MKTIRYRRDLWQLLKAPGAAAEIGVAEGNFSRDMLEWKLKDGQPAVTKLYLVDRWRTVQTQRGDAAMPPEWHEKNMAEAVAKMSKHPFERFSFLRGDSDIMAEDVEDGELSLLYIDGDHSYEGCFRDLRAWVPKVKRGGFVALHDYLNENYGVKKAVQAFCAGNFQVHVIEEDKPEDAGAWFQVC